MQKQKQSMIWQLTVPKPQKNESPHSRLLIQVANPIIYPPKSKPPQRTRFWAQIQLESIFTCIQHSTHNLTMYVIIKDHSKCQPIKHHRNMLGLKQTPKVGLNLVQTMCKLLITLRARPATRVSHLHAQYTIPKKRSDLFFNFHTIDKCK